VGKRCNFDFIKILKRLLKNTNEEQVIRNRKSKDRQYKYQMRNGKTA